MYRLLGIGFAITAVIVLGLPFERVDASGIASLQGSCGEDFELIGHVGGPVRAVAIQDNFAFLAVGQRLLILDVSNPQNPILAGTSDILPGIAYDIEVSGQHVYIAMERYGVGVVDVSRPNSLTYHGSFGSWVEDVSLFDNNAFTVGSKWFKMFDVSDPESPVEKWHLELSVEHLEVDGGFAYLTDSTGVLHIFDVSQTDSPVELGSVQVGEKLTAIEADGQYAYILEHAGLTSKIKVIDVMDPAQPSVIGAYEFDFFPSALALTTQFVFVADNGGIRVIDITVPAQPREIIHIEAGLMTDIAVSGDTLYVAGNLRGEGLRLYDISNPRFPSRAGIFQTAGSANAMEIQDSLAYVASTSGFQIVDIADPESALVKAYIPIPDSADDIALLDKYAYVATNEGLEVFDISSPENPVKAGSFHTGWNGVRVAIHDEYLYLLQWHIGLKVLDITDPTQPHEIFTVELPPRTKDMVIVGDYAYIAAYEEGLRILDVTDPARPLEVGFLNTIGEAEAVAVASDQAQAYVSTNDRGVRLIDVSSPQQPELIQGVVLPGDFSVMTVDGSKLYAGGTFERLILLDITNLSHPSQVGCFPIIRYVEDVKATSNNVYVAGYSGLLILETVTEEDVAEELATNTETDNEHTQPSDEPMLETILAEMGELLDSEHTQPSKEDSEAGPESASTPILNPDVEISLNREENSTQLTVSVIVIGIVILLGSITGLGYVYRRIK